MTVLETANTTPIHQPRLQEAYAHPAYDASLHRAAQRAHGEGGEFAVYYDGVAMYVRAAEAARPPAALLVCIAGRWDAKTVQLRFNGAHSEWVNF